VPEAGRVRAATAADLDALLAVDVLLVARERQAAILRESVARGGCLVIPECDGLAGFVTWDLGFFGRPFVRLLVVVPRARRGGLGRALLAAVEAAAAPHGELFVSTEQKNAPMQALLAGLGYVPSGAVDHVNEPGNLELVYYTRLPRTAA
jgi:GNAT superfamily N-acetyltransferase